MRGCVIDNSVSFSRWSKHQCMLAQSGVVSNCAKFGENLGLSSVPFGGLVNIRLLLWAYTPKKAPQNWRE